MIKQTKLLLKNEKIVRLSLSYTTYSRKLVNEFEIKSVSIYKSPIGNKFLEVAVNPENPDRKIRTLTIKGNEYFVTTTVKPLRGWDLHGIYKLVHIDRTDKGVFLTLKKKD